MDLSTVQCLDYQEPEDLHAIKLLNHKVCVVIVLTVAERWRKNSTEATSRSRVFNLKFFSLGNDTTWVVCLKLDLKDEELS